MNVLLLLILFTVRSVRSIILIPEEVPSLLSIVYSNIPPVLKGTDSRLGIGFRLGPNADFQYQIELGPQTRTQQIGPDAPAPEASKKRHVQPNQLGSLPSKDKPHWIYTWNNINPESIANKDKDSVPANFEFDQPQQGDMVNQVNYGGAQYQNNGVASHLYKLYEQSTLNKQRTSSTTAVQDKQGDSVIVSNVAKESHRLAPPKDRISQASESKMKQSISHKTQINVDKVQPPVDLSTTNPLVHNSKVNKASLIPLEKPKQVNQSSTSESEIRDQEIEASENHDIVSEAETENRINQIHSLTHSQFIQRVPASQKKDK
ncbi:hypothetical protein WDU94_008150 [Cyamophila willieti]